MSDAENLRDSILRQTKDEFENISLAAHEATAAKRILNKLRPDISLAAIRKDLPNSQLNLRLLHEIMPSFPMQLFAASTPWLSKITVADLLNGELHKTSLFRKYIELVEREGLNVHHDFAGLVTCWPKATTIVMHNWPHKDETVDRQKSFGRFVFVHNKSTTPVMYTIEPLDSLITIIAKAGLCQP